MSRTALYRHFDAAGVLLYVGISLSAVQRLAQHRDKPWFRQIARVDVEWFDDRGQAERAEVAAIRRERPAHNVRHATGLPVPAPGRVAFGVRHDRSGRVDGWYGDRIDAKQIAGWLSAMFPRDVFTIVPRPAGPCCIGVDIPRLDTINHAAWAAASPDYAAADAFEREAA